MLFIREGEEGKEASLPPSPMCSLLDALAWRLNCSSSSLFFWTCTDSQQIYFIFFNVSNTFLYYHFSVDVDGPATGPSMNHVGSLPDLAKAISSISSWPER